MNKFLIVLKALFRNKLRFADNATKGKKNGFIALIGFSYLMVIGMLMMTIIDMGVLLQVPEIAVMVYMFGLLTVSAIVLFFGIFNLVSTLYLCKDTDFFSMLPIKSSTVFAAKLVYVYLSEAIISYAIMLPLLITFGVVAKMWAGFYIISILGLLIIPALPLFVAALVAIPVMFIASKLKNRAVVSLIFYLVLFGGFMGVYLYFVSTATDFSNYTEDTIINFFDTIDVLLKVLYPYTTLAYAACGITSFGLDIAGSTAANIAIFVGISLVLICIMLVCSRFMYAQSAKANNQTNNAKSGNGRFKPSGITKTIMKREFVGALRTTQVAFQCFAVVIIPIVFAVVFCIVGRNTAGLFDEAVGLGSDAIDELIQYYKDFMSLISVATLAMMFATLGNAAATTFSREGSALATLKVLPVSIKQILIGKLLAWLCLALPAAIISVVIISVSNFDIVKFVLSFFALVPLAFEFVLFGALWDLSSPKLKWTDPMQAVKHNGHTTIGQFICMAGGFVALIAIIVCANLDLAIGAISAVCWAALYFVVAIFAIVDAVLACKAHKFYNRIEI